MMTTRTLFGWAMLLCALPCVPHAARAQWDAGATGMMGAGMGNIALSQSIMSGMGQIGVGRQRSGIAYRDLVQLQPRGPSRAALASPRQLQFSSTREISAQVQADIVAQLARQRPELREQLATEFRQADAVSEFRRMIARYGYSPDNLAHTMAAFLIIQWEVATDSTANATQMRGAVEQVERSLLSGPLLSRLSEGDKQAFAESMAYQATLSAAIRNDLRRRGDEQSLAALRRGVIDSTRELGWDFSRVDLGAQGFQLVGR